MDVQWRYRDSDSIGTARGIVLEKNENQATIEVTQNGDRTGSIVTIPLNHLTFLDNAFSPDLLKSQFAMGTPTPEQLTKINEYIPIGSPPMTADEVVTVPFLVADNLINRSLDAWDKDSLKNMPALTLGLPFTLDHDWDETSKEWGTIYSSQFLQFKTVPTSVYDRAGNGSANLQIIKKDGYCCVVTEVFAMADSPVIRALRSGHSGGVSTGGFQFVDYHCPICSASFYDDQCPHLPPDPYWGFRPGEDSIAPYALRVGLYDMGEISIVTLPNLPNAGIIK